MFVIGVLFRAIPRLLKDLAGSSGICFDTCDRRMTALDDRNLQQFHAKASGEVSVGAVCLASSSTLANRLATDSAYWFMIVLGAILNVGTCYIKRESRFTFANRL